MLPISDIIIRSISGYVFIVPILILYFLYLRKSGREQSLLHIAAVSDSIYFSFSNPYTHFPLKNRYRKITELMLQVRGYAQNITRISEIRRTATVI